MRRQFSCQLEADNLGEHHRDLLTKHDRLGFNTADTPSDDTKAIDHGCVRVSSDHRVGVKHTVLLEDDTSEPLQVDLMDNTVARWHDSEVAEGGLTPLEEGKSLLVSIEFDLLITVLGVGATSNIDLDGMIND